MKALKTMREILGDGVERGDAELPMGGPEQGENIRIRI